MNIPAQARTICLEIQYDGAQYCGWQRQPKQQSVQEMLECAIERVSQEKVTCVASGRTDSGVHARKQVVSFVLRSSKANLEAYHIGVNRYLPDDIRVLCAKEVSEDFHAIRNSYSKTYRYFFSLFPTQNLFYRHYVWNLSYSIDISQMKQACEVFVGTHDFSCFQTHPREKKSHVRTIQALSVQPMHDFFFIEVKADGFLRHMVRALVGTLIDAGRGKISVEDCSMILTSLDRNQAGQTAPAHALFLWDVFYDETSKEKSTLDLSWEVE
ncbi:MAG: tRNA pseudouridine(38-40) synthase TruA [Bdellovibrionota bacterium]